MQNIMWFKDLSKKDIPIVGGKGANLGELFNADFPIPEGFVVTADAYKLFLERTGIQKKIFDKLADLDVEDTEALQKASNEIQHIITSAEMPEEIKQDTITNYDLIDTFVAVRSSATAEDLPDASFAGQQATFLNVKGAKNVVEATQKCWASLFTARAIYYREKNNFKHEEVFIAVVIQKMVNSDKAGVLFSVNPVTNSEDEIIIEGAFGLGESVVSGSINPDLYIVNKHSLNIKEKTVNEQEWGLFRDEETGENTRKNIPDPEKQVLTDHEITELAELGKKVEKHYKFPQDIEWAVEGRKIYLTQSRPVTTFKK